MWPSRGRGGVSEDDVSVFESMQDLDRADCNCVLSKSEYVVPHYQLFIC